MASPPTTAVLFIDFQKTFLEFVPEPTRTSLLSSLQRFDSLIDSISTPSLRPLVIRVRTAYRPGYPEIPKPEDSVDFKLYGAGSIKGLVGMGIMKEGDKGTEFHPASSPQFGDLVVTKTRASAFLHTDLEMLLRSKGVRRLVICGIATSAAVLATAREAKDRDWDMVEVVDDCCADVDEEMDGCCKKVLRSFARLRKVEEYEKEWGEDE